VSRAGKGCPFRAHNRYSALAQKRPGGPQTPSGQQQDPSEQQQDPSPQQSCSGQQDVPLEQQDVPLEQQDVPLEQQDDPLEQQDDPPEQQDGKLEQHEAPLVQLDTSVPEEGPVLVTGLAVGLSTTTDEPMGGVARTGAITTTKAMAQRKNRFFIIGILSQE
jgi:hypothetical protein